MKGGKKMKKKITLVIITCSILIGGARTLVYADSNEDTINDYPFKQVMEKMEKAHPDLSAKELKQMYSSCHGEENTKMMEI
jgi:peptidoglycan hydrolase CwlO-like protein